MGTRSGQRFLAVLGEGGAAVEGKRRDEPGDAVAWLREHVAGPEAEIDVLLRGPAVGWMRRPAEAVPRASVFYIWEDAHAFGVAGEAARARAVAADNVPSLLRRYSQIWHW